ncbi:MAG: response regulator transcription factor [Candidatus Promineifilaceae bacterium]
MIRLLIVDQSRLICDSFRAAVEGESDIYVVGCATTLEEADWLLPTCNLALVSTAGGRDEALAFISAIRQRHPDVKILATGLNDEPKVILGYVEAGSMGYVLRDDSVAEMLKKVRATHNGEALVSPNFAARLMSHLAALVNGRYGQAEAAGPRMHLLDELTGREKEVLELIGAGHTNRQIAEQLVIECGTVKNHVHNILKKLESASRNEAANIYRIYQHSVYQPRPAGVLA